MQFAEVVATSSDVARQSGRLEKTARLAALVARTPVDEIETVVPFLTGSLRQGRIGTGYRAIAAAADVAPAPDASLTVGQVDRAFGALADLTGKGSARERSQALRSLFAQATADEQDFLRRLLYGELRQGALEGVLIEAIARAAGVPPAAVRRAAMLAGDLGAVARAALTNGAPGLDALSIQLMRPVLPMLADSEATVDAALDRLDDASLEYKLDGARIQVHKAGDEVRVFSRTLREVTDAAPEVVELVRAAPARELILDGEVIALRPDGRPHPFQVTMRRFGRTRDVAETRLELPLTPAFFDCLYLDGASLLDAPLDQRAAALGDAAGSLTVPRLVRPSRDAAQKFVREALDRGHEGVMAKSLTAPYAAGRRGAAWLKVKQARTLDLVVLAAEWGHGRRQGFLSNLHLGARDPEHQAFVMLGKTFKGMTDEMLAWQTDRLLALEIGRDAHTVHVRPELVIEIAFNEIQESPTYAGGLVLRFARVRRYRTDKTAAEADTIATVRTLATW